MAIKGKEGAQLNPFNWTSFSRTSFTQPEGMIPSHIVEAKVFNVNLKNWTVDVQSSFDQRTFLDVQVGQPYLHSTAGEGIYCVPEVGAKCQILIPSDSSPPIVLCFIMPVETLPNTSTEDAPEGTAPTGGIEQGSKDFSFSGGRTRPKPGDITIKGRDGNFMILHRGGVAQFGCSPLAQRICIPLNNLVTDISQNYNHFNGGGSVNWGIQDRGSKSPGAEFRQVQRVYADDKYADIRYSFGRVRSPVPEPVGDAGETSNLEQLGIGKTDIVFEFVLARGGFESDAGDFKAKAEDVRIRIFFDRDGNGMARFEGSVDVRIKKKLRVTVDDNIDVLSKKAISITGETTARVTGGSALDLGTNGGVVTLNSGTNPVATVGSQVKVVLAPGTTLVTQPLTSGATAVTLAAGLVLNGIVISGNPTVLS